MVEQTKIETVLIAGGSGTIGKHLSNKLLQKGYRVALLSRHKTTYDNISNYFWNVEKQLIDKEAFQTADYIINLAGENISKKRWSKKRKKEILDSRVKSNKLLLKTIQKLNVNPKAYITASAVGFYGVVTSNKIFTENDLSATDFLGTTCNEWEASCELAEELKIRTVKLRTGVVLNIGDGALSKMTLPIKLLIGSPLGSGKQYIPWIHIDDLCNVYLKAIEDINMEGPYNAVAPEHVSNKELTEVIAKMLSRPILLPNVPAIVLKLVFGEMANIILEGSRVSSDKLSRAGFSFLYPKLSSALHQLLKAEK